MCPKPNKQIFFSAKELSPSDRTCLRPADQTFAGDKVAVHPPDELLSNASGMPDKVASPSRLPGRRQDTGKPNSAGNSGPFLNVKQVAARYSVSIATIWRWAKERADFPQPRKLGSGSTRWMLDELLEFEAGLSEDK